MLETMRKATKSWVVKGLLVLIALSFVSWGVGDMVTRGFGPGAAIEVGGTEISAQQVETEFRREVERLQPLFGGQLTVEDARKLGLLDRTIDTIVARTLIDEAARQLGLTVSDDAVVAEVAAEPAFRNELGQFDRDRLRAALARAGMSEGEFLRIEKSNLVRGQMAEALSAGVQAPESLVDPLVRLREERRVAETVLVRDSSIPAPAAPDDATLEQYYKDNTDAFMAPEYRAVTALMLRPKDVADAAVTDEMIAEAYQQRMGEFHTPELREVSQVVLDTDKAAAEAAEMVKAGRDLGAIAKATESEVVDLGAVERADLPDELAGPVFDLPRGQVSAPIQTSLGWHVIKVGKVSPERTRPLAEVKDQLAEDLRHERALDGLAELANQVEDALGGGATLEEAAQRFNLQLVKAESVDAQGLGRDGKPVAGLPQAESFLDVAFSTEQGTESMLTDMGGNGYFLVRVDAVTPPQPRPLDEIKPQVVAAWQAEKRRELAGQRAENLAEHVRKGQSFAQAAQAFGLKADKTEAFTRDGADTVGLPPAVVSDLFEVQAGGVAVGATPGGWMVARLDKVVPFDPASHEDEVAATRERVSAAVSGDLVDQFINALRGRLGVAVDRSQIARQQ